MLNRAASMKKPQNGAVLMITLIILAVMTLTGITLIRSVDTTTLIAGNLAFQHSTRNLADQGIETAIDWLISQPADTLFNDSPDGYKASYHPSQPSGDNPDSSLPETWNDFWSRITHQTVPPPADYSLAYVIHRLCDKSGNPDPMAAGDPSHCSTPPTPPDATQQEIYYRIIAHAEGPRKASSFVQVVVAMPRDPSTVRRISWVELTGP